MIASEPEDFPPAAASAPDSSDHSSSDSGPDTPVTEPPLEKKEEAQLKTDVLPIESDKYEQVVLLRSLDQPEFSPLTLDGL